ncbi:hypothetical protein CspHIS471_0303310 [Cutaneotrichosporon sp. HIS471]|nr:hypothetical protein CspHIS471_0303310 [Cutaneotrichosporon sp. HIS471]
MPRLDVETDEQRRERLGNLFSTLSTPPTSTGEEQFPLPPSRPFAMPESDALARARAFLPLLAASNADLVARKDKGEDVAIDAALGQAEDGPDGPQDEDARREEEEGGEEGKTHVEMDVGVGVFDVNGEVKGDLGPVVERDAGVWAGGKGDGKGE